MASEFDPNTAKPIDEKKKDGIFDPSTAVPSKPQNKGIGGDVVTALKQGVEELPGAVTGLADIPAAALGFNRPFSRAADVVGDATGFKPGKWAKQAEAEYSPATQQAKQAIDQVWADPNTTATDVARAYAENPRATALNAVQSVPSMVAGGIAGRVVGGAAGIASSAARGAIGEGAISAGQTMEQIDPSVDPQKAAGLSAAGGAAVGAIGGFSGRVANRLGIGDPENLIAGGINNGAAAVGMPIQKRIPAGVLREGLLEEAPQSAVEQAAQNIAENKPITEGMARNVVEGSLAGGLMGGAGAVVDTSRPAEDATGDDKEAGFKPRQGQAPSAAGPAPSITGTDPASLMRSPIGGMGGAGDGFMDAIRERKPSEAMGLDPASGPMSAAAALAVDTGAGLAASVTGQDGASLLQRTSEGNKPLQEAMLANDAERTRQAEAAIPFDNASEADRRAYEDAFDRPAPTEFLALSSDERKSILYGNKEVNDGGQQFSGTLDGDILNGMGTPFKTRFAAARRAHMMGKEWGIEPVADGFVARWKGNSNESQQGVQALDQAGTGSAGPITQASAPNAHAGAGQDRGNAARPTPDRVGESGQPAAGRGEGSVSGAVAPTFSLDNFGWNAKKLSDAYNMEQLNTLYKEVRDQFSNKVVGGGPVDDRGMATKEPLNPVGKKMHDSLKKAIGIVYEKNKAAGGATNAASTQAAQPASGLPAAGPAPVQAAGANQQETTKAKWLKAINDQNRLAGETGIQLKVVDGKLTFMGDPRSSKQGRALNATFEEAQKAGATIQEIIASIQNPEGTTANVPQPAQPGTQASQAPSAQGAAPAGAAVANSTGSGDVARRAPPNSVIKDVRDFDGRKLADIVVPHDGTKEGILKAAEKANRQMIDQYGNHATHSGSRIGATDENGNPAWVISPNLENIEPYGTREGSYIWGDLSAEPESSKKMAGKTMADIVAKQIPDMTDDELAAARDHYGPGHKRTAKITKEINRRALAEKLKPKPATRGEKTNGPQADQAQQAEAQRQEAPAAAGELGRFESDGVGRSEAEKELQAQSHKEEQPGDVLMADGSFVAFDVVVAMAKEGIAAGAIRPAPAQMHFKLDMSMRDANRVLDAATKPADQAPGEALQSAMGSAGWAAEVAGAGNTIWTKRTKKDRYTAILTPESNSMEITVLVDTVDTQIASFKVADPKDAAIAANKAVSEDVADSVPAAEKPVADRTETEHAGLKIYPIKVKMGDAVVEKWAVQTPDNAQREKNGERQIGGDPLSDTLDEAKKNAESEVRIARERAERDAESKAEEAAAQAKKDANKGKSILQRRADALLDKKHTYPPQAGLGAGTRREAMESAVDQGRAIVERMVPDTAAKNRDQAAIDLVRARGYILGLSNENIPVVKQGLEAQARMKANQYEKPEYRVYDSAKTDGGFYEITKTEYDYAQELKAQRAAAPQAEPAPAAASQQSQPQPPKEVGLTGIDKEYASLTQLRGTKVMLTHPDGRILYDVQLSVPWRRKNMIGTFPMQRFQFTENFEVKSKSDVTGNPGDKGFVLIDKRAQNAQRASQNPTVAPASQAQQSAPAASSQQATDDFLPEGWTKSVNGYTKRPVYRMEQGGGQPFAVVTQVEGMRYEVQIRHGDKQLIVSNQTGALSEVLAKAETELTRMTQADSVTHQDPGEKAEAATPGVVTDSLKKAARNEDTKPSEMRKWLVAEIDKELLQAADRPDYDEAVKRMGEKDAISMFTGNGPLGKNNETGFITFDVPGDGKYKVRNSVRGLLEFRKNVMASQGFKDGGQKRAKPEQNDGVQGGSGGNMTAITNMIDEGDFEAARDYAEAVGIARLFVSRTPKNRDVLYAEQDGKLREVTSVSAEQKAQWERFMRDGTLPTPPDTKPQPAPKTAAQVDEEKRQAAEAEAKKPKDTGWNMAGTGYGGKRYLGRNITTADGREIVARVYENAGDYDEVEVKVDGVRKFTVRDSYNAQDKADAFIKTVTGKAADSASSDMTPEEAAKYLKDFVYSLNQLDGMTDRAQVLLSSPLGKSGRDNLLMEAFGLNREQAHDINNRIDARQPKKLRNIDMQDAFDVFPSLRKMVYDAIQQAQAKEQKTPPQAPAIPEGYKPAGEPFYRGGKQIQGYAPFTIGERVTMKDSAGQSGVIESLASPDDSGVFASAVVKFDNGMEQMVQFGKLEASAAQPITRADVTAAQQQAAALIAERIDAMTAGEVNTIARRFLPTMGVKPTVSKERNKAAVTDFTKVNLMAAADEFGVTLPADVRRALDAEMQGKVADAQPVVTYIKGDRAEYTGNTETIGGGLFYEVRFTEGAKNGKTALTQRAPDGTNPGQRGPVKPTGIVTPQLSGNPGQFIKIAADSINALRKVDVDRVLTETPAAFRQEVAAYIRDQRKDLADEVDEVMDEIQPKAAEKRFNVPTPPTWNYRLKQRGGSTYLIPPVGQAFTPETRRALRDWARDAGYSASIITDNEVSVAAVTGGPSLDYIVDGVKEQAYGRQADKERSAMLQSATGSRRDPAKVSMFAPYEDGDVVSIDGQDWTVKQDTPGWYLTNTGNWRGTHPTIRNIKAMADLIREVEQASVARKAAEIEPETPKLTQAEAKSLMAWEDLGQKDGVKTHALTFYESQADKDAKRGRMIVAKVSKGDRSANNWMVDGEDKTFWMLAQAKKLAEEVGMARAVADGFVEEGAEAPKSTEKPAAPATTSAPIEDAGEKIGGARKDRWKERGLNLDDLDAMTEAEGAELATKANVWKPDYEALAAQSEPVSAAMTKVIYDRLAAKPKKNTPEGRRQYVQMMRIVRDVYTEANGPEAVKNAYLEIRNRAGLNTKDPQAKAAARELLFSVYKGRSDPFVLDGGDLMKVKKMVADGFPAKGEPWKTRLTVGRVEGGPGTTERGIEIYVERSAEVGTPLTREQILGGFYRVTTKDNRTVAFAPTKADAEAAAATVYERDMKGKKDGKPEPVRPNLDELKRENLPQRIDRDVTSEDFVRDLGFRGVEFGLWSAQDERQRILNMAYDGLMDLAEIMGVPPKAMSLNGTLGMAFGARGGGRFAAHYEPGKLVINMTKIRGGGSMAHEWAHAMDHYFGELDKPDAYTTQARGASGWYSEDQYLGVPRKRMERVGNEWKAVEKMRLDNLRPEMAAAFDEVMRALFSQQVTKAEMVRSHELDLERTEALARNETQADLKAMYQNMVQNKRQALDELRGDPEDTMYAGRGRSDYASQAQALSGKSENGYWTRPTEMFARAFESWVFDKVTAMGARSDYLVHGVEEDRFAGGAYKGNPYPTGEERARINAAFDKLSRTIKTKETDKGVAMFSRGASGAMSNSQVGSAFKAMVKQARSDLEGVLFNWQEVELNEDGDRMISRPGRDRFYSKGKEGGSVSVTKRSFIEWLQSEGPFDAKIYGPNIAKDAEWVQQIKTLRGLIQGEQNRPEAQFSRGMMFSPAAQAQSIEAVERVVSGIAESWQNGPRIVVAFDMQDARIPERVRLEDQKQRSGGARGAPEGFYYDGTAYLMASQLKTPNDTARVLFHEALGHHGLRGAFGKELDNVLRQIATMRRAEVDAKIKEYGLRGVSNLDRLTAAEEVLAEMAQTTPDIGFVQRAIAAIRTWLRKNVPGFKDLALTDAEIIRSYILPARGWVERGPGGGGPKGGVSFARGAKSGDAENTRYTRQWYDRLVGLLPDSYRNDPYRREPLPAESGNVQQAREVQSKIDALNKQIRGPRDTKGYGPVTRDELGNLRVDAREATFSEIIGEIRDLADEIGYGVSVTGVQRRLIEKFKQAGFESEISLAAIADRITGVRTEISDEKSVYAVQALGTIMSYKPRGFPMALFSRSKAADDAKAAVVTNLKTYAHKAGNRLADFRHLALGSMGRRQLVDVYGDILPLDRYNTLVQQMDADKNEAGAEADTLADTWGKLNSTTQRKDEDRRLAEIMHDATLARIDPDKPLKPGDDPDVHAELAHRFSALSEEAKTIYRQARGMYADHFEKVKTAIRERILRSELTEGKNAALLERMDAQFFDAVKGVYFPLQRFGQYVIVVRNVEGDVQSVNRAETLNEAEETRRVLLKAFPAAGGFTVAKVLKSREFAAQRDMAGRGFMKELFDVLDKQGVSDDVQDSINQLYLASLPDLSWAKHGIHRKGTPGFSQDARRAFAQNIFHGARYLAKIRYADQLQTELEGMQEHVDNWTAVEDVDSVKAQQVVDEFVKRHELLMNPDANPISTALTSLGFVFHLGLSPASAIVNLTQTAMVAYPIMGAKWGFDKSAAALMAASKEAAKNRNDISKVLAGDEKRAYDEAVRAGVIDVTQAHDLAGISQGEDAKVTWKLRPVMKAASFLFHHAEKFNRQVTFVAAYRLARAADTDHQAAYEQAVNATYAGHFDYSSSNRPRFMQGNVARVVLLFKQYAQNMIFTLGREAQLSINGTDAEKKEARKALAGLLTTHALAAGVLGLPLVGSLLSLASMLGGDDDEPWDAKTALQNMLADSLGQKPAEVIAHGLSRLTPWDISGRVGLDKLLLPDIQEGLEGSRAVEAWMASALGAVGGIAINAGRGMTEISEGRWARGLEAMMPAVLRGPLKAYRYATEGNIDKTGIPINEEVGAAGIAGQVLGFSPSETRLAQEGRSAIYQADRAIMERRSHLLRQYGTATLAGDEEGRADAREAIQRFNEKNPKARINPVQMAQSVRSRLARVQQSDAGVFLPRNRRSMAEFGRFAESE